MDEWTREFLTDSRLAHLATSTSHGVPHVVPICYVFDGTTIYSSIDEKPKRTGPNHLRRVLNVLQNPNVSVVVDRYSEDWRKLRYVLVCGLAEIVGESQEQQQAVALLRNKYQQYRSMKLAERPILKIRPVKVIAWNAGGA